MCSAGVNAAELLSRRRRRLDPLEARASPRRRAPPRWPAAARRSPGGRRCRARASSDGRGRAPRAQIRYPRLTGGAESDRSPIETDVAVVGRRRGRPLRGAARRRARGGGDAGLAKAARRERQLLGPGRPGGSAGARRLAGAPRAGHPQRRPRALPVGGGRSRSRARRRRRWPSFASGACGSTSIPTPRRTALRTGSRSRSRAATRRGASSTPAARRPAARSRAGSPSWSRERRAGPGAGGDLGAGAVERRRRCAGVITDAGAIAARATVLATGGGAALWRRTTNPWGAIGAGAVLAHAAGAALADLEFCQFHPTALALPGSEHDGTLLTEALRGEGAELLDASGRRFTDELAPARSGDRRDPRPHGGRRDGPRDARPALDLAAALPERVRGLPRRGPRPRGRAGPGGARRPLPDGRRRLRPRRRARRCRASTPSANAHAAASTARIAWPRNSLTECFVFGARAAAAAASARRAGQASAPRRTGGSSRPPRRPARPSGAMPARVAAPTGSSPCWTIRIRWPGSSRGRRSSAASRAGPHRRSDHPLQDPGLDGVHLVMQGDSLHPERWP